MVYQLKENEKGYCIYCGRELLSFSVPDGFDFNSGEQKFNKILICSHEGKDFSKISISDYKGVKAVIDSLKSEGWFHTRLVSEAFVDSGKPLVLTYEELG